MFRFSLLLVLTVSCLAGIQNGKYIKPPACEPANNIYLTQPVWSSHKNEIKVSNDLYNADTKTIKSFSSLPDTVLDQNNFLNNKLASALVFTSPSGRYLVYGTTENRVQMLDTKTKVVSQIGLPFLVAPNPYNGSRVVWSLSEVGFLYIVNGDYPAFNYIWIEDSKIHIVDSRFQSVSKGEIYLDYPFTPPSVNFLVAIKGVVNHEAGTSLWIANLKTMIGQQVKLAEGVWDAQFTPDGKFLYIIGENAMYEMEVATRRIIAKSDLSEIDPSHQGWNNASISYTTDYVLVDLVSPRASTWSVQLCKIKSLFENN